jgi:hypothetical protein
MAEPQLSQRVKDRVAERRQDLALDDLHRSLDLGLVPWTVDARGEDRRAIVCGEILIRRMDHGLVVTRGPHAGSEVVGHEQRRHAAVRLEHPDVRPDPVGERLGPGGLGVQQVTRA